MLVLFETAAGYAIFKLLDEKKLAQTDDLYKDFASPESACKVVKLKHFEKFEDTTEALAAMTACVEGKLSKSLKKTIKKHVGAEMKDSLLISDPKLSAAIREKFDVQCVTNTAVHELMRCIRSQLDGLLAGLPKKEMTAMSLGLAHSLSRYKLKFSPDKIDTMIVQAIGLLDELDKELNNYIMRCREWYGWHFPELGKIITDNLTFVKTVKLVGTRDHAVSSDLSDILPEDVEEKVKEAAEISMGTEISDEDILKIQHLCEQVIDITSYRTQLYEYLKARMMAMAPNFTVLVGELVGARLISHAGSLVNLAKLPASTIQILGAEKALFRALKTKKETPKYGLIYHTQLVGQSSVKNKGKMSRMLGAKAALAVRVDALGEDVSFELGAAHKATLESRLRILEENNLKRISGTGKAKAKFEKYHGVSEIKQYQDADDSTIPTTSKRKRSEVEEVKTEPVDFEETTPKQKKKKAKKEAMDVKEEPEDDAEEESAETSQKKKKKKKKRQDEDEESQPEKKSRSSGEEEVVPKSEPDTPKSEKKKKKKKSLSEQPDSSETFDTSVTDTPKSDKKKKSESESTSPTTDSTTSEKKKKKKKSKDVVEQEDE